ncbi:MAG: hypothetical protein H0X42_07050 [Solirubrobacterales bacterium]|nr:hypothetical protein [Solirubrobacterales bacterium]
MKRLIRHPIRAIREPFGTAGLIVAMIALVAALGGTALAAAKLNSTQKKEVTKIAKKFAGKPGANGANGTNGSNGAPGAKGDAGAAGSPGANGESVKVTSLSSPKCNGQAGVEFSNASGSGKACNGQTGFTETLPAGKTETGIWSVGPITEAGTGTSYTIVPIASFPIPLASPLDGAHVHYIDPAGEEVLGTAFSPTTQPPGPECEGSAALPSAASGNLCIYAGNQEGGISGASESIIDPSTASAGAAASGAIGLFKLGGVSSAVGVWAVTG